MPVPSPLAALPGTRLYFVHPSGRVFKVGPEGGRAREVSQQLGSHGYYQFAVCEEGSKRTIKVSVAVLTAFVGPSPSPRHQAAHLNNVKTDHRLANLAWLTARESRAAREGNGVWDGVAEKLRGQKSGRSKLNDELVREIRRLDSEKKMSRRRMARELGVSSPAIDRICNGITWKHVA